MSWGNAITEPDTENKETEDKTAEEEEPPKAKEASERSFIVTGGVDDLVKVWDIENESLKLKHTLNGHSLGVVSVDVSKNGKIIASTSLDSTLMLHNAETGHIINKLSLGPLDLWTVAISPDNKFCVFGSHDGKISMYNIEKNTIEQVLDPQNGKFCLSIACSPDGKIASGSIDGIIYIFDVSTGKVTQTLEGHAMPVRSLCFSPDSQLLLTASDDGHSKIYDVAHSHTDVSSTLSGHLSWVLSVNFSADGKRFASSSSDKTVKIWDLRERKSLKTFAEHTDKVTGVAYSPDSNKVVSVSEDRSINIYDCPSTVE